ncbi:MAG: PTS sugar transporter subunit IIA [Chromatiaceae bacterium]
MFPPQFLTVDRIAGGVEITSKKRLLEVLAGLLSSAQPQLHTDTILERLLERERLGSTGLGHGVALPHARVQEAGEAIGAFVQVRQAVDFDAIDEQPVDLAFAMLVPEAATEVHLQLLAQLAGLFGEEEFRERLRQTDEPVALLALLLGGANLSPDG